MGNVNMDKLGERIFDLATKYWGYGTDTGLGLADLDEDELKYRMPDEVDEMQDQLRDDIKELLAEPDIFDDEDE